MTDIKPGLVPIQHNQTSCSNCSIRRLALFHGVPEEDLSWTQKYRSCQYKLSANREIFRESHHSEFLYTVYHGWIAIYKTLENGKRQILKIALPGDIIGYQANIEAEMNYSGVSLTDTVLCAFPRKDMPELFRKNNNITQRLTELNSRDMNLCQNRLLTIGQHTAIEKIAHFCAELFFRIKTIYDEPKDDHINFPLSQEDIGDATGLTKIHVNRTLKQLRERGLMEISSRTLKILDIDKLCELGSFDKSTVHTHILY